MNFGSGTKNPGRSHGGTIISALTIQSTSSKRNEIVEYLVKLRGQHKKLKFFSDHTYEDVLISGFDDYEVKTFFRLSQELHFLKWTKAKKLQELRERMLLFSMVYNNRYKKQTDEEVAPLKARLQARADKQNAG